ncbi:amino acid ABC transporter permease [Stackebrandtia nassauensis]|uniref:Polar amino acid ABC transporter, inner membrane subunit n=1 Tax=Stackebrandtia nassauensis (strain DSM 44728 / CIP 108903 / NRRL B-16338 / NBRC 102104 / LLR-40K-21) TaxID=446470 RepID=D3PZV0_STANL|nr:amino acid ABC transporter permease [Stackebrandtia nassauensis]ADD43637.1 polar amino acid ABC transporter, inner membrane subunit [Stackebrandtia nassauensis DSM 44728]
MFQNLDYVLPILAQGFVTTLWLTLASFALALVIGGILALMHVSPAPPARWAATAYTQFFRNIPLLVILVLFLFGFTALGIGKGMASWIWAIIGLGTYTGALVGETLRSGINSISLGQAEAARSIGLTFGQSLSSVILPQAFRTVVPPLGSLFIALVKNSALASAVGIIELSGVADQLQEDRNVSVSIWTIVIGVILFYLIINLPASYLIRVAEKRAAISR